MEPVVTQNAETPASSHWWAPLAEWRERLSERPLVVAGGAVAVSAAVLVAILLLRAPSGPPPALTLPRAGEGAGAGPPAGPAGAAEPTPAGQPAPAMVTVHAAGAVAHPGVYAVPGGARVADVVAAAGGPLPEADLERLNLAARVSDGDRVRVPRQGEPEPAEAAGPSGQAPSPAAPAGAVTGPIDLNTATAEQLDTLPGVGPATARAIITYRTRAGRFRSVTELLEVPGIGPTKLEALRPLVKV